MSKLSQGWIDQSLGELVEFNPKHDRGLDLSTEVTFVPMPAVDDKTGTIIDLGTNKTLDEVWKGYTHFQNGDVIFAKITPCMENGKIAVASSLKNGLACGSTEFHVLRSQGAVEPKYVWRYLRQLNFRRDAEKSMTGAVGQRRVPRQYLQDMRLPVPPLPEQKRIVAKLDALSARSDRARKELTRIDTLVTRYKQAVLSKAFSGELTKAWRRHYDEEKPIEPLNSKLPDDREDVFKKTKRQDLPSNWRNLKLGQLGKVLGGGTPNKKEPSYWGGPIPWVTPKDMKVDQIASAIDMITEAGLDGSSAKLVPEASLLFVVRGMILAHSFPVAINKRSVTVNQDMKALIPLSNLLPEYLLFGLKSLKDTVVMLAGSATHGTKRLESSVILNVAIPVAPFSEQKEIVCRIEGAFQKIDQLAVEAKRALELTDKLDEAILAKAFRGELVPQDPNEEPASVLIDRIKAERAATPKAKRGRKKG